MSYPGQTLNPNPNEGPTHSPVDHPDDEEEQGVLPPSIHRNSGGIHRGAPLPQLSQQISPTNIAGQSAGGILSSLASKPHAFGGAVLSPDHARHLTTDLVLQLASALSVQASHAANSRGVLPPGENVNLFMGSDLVDLLIGLGGSTTNAQGNATNPGVFRGAPPATPGTPKSNTNQPAPHILQLLRSSGGTPGNATPGATITPSTSTNNALTSPAATPTDQLNASITSTTNMANQINPLSLLSTAEALESFASWRTHYTVWITEAWNILKWSEPSAALFWEMATMFHTLYVASLSVRGGGSGGIVRGRVLGVVDDGPTAVGGAVHPSVSVTGSVTMKPSLGAGGASALNTTTSSTGGNYIPPLLSCGSQSSMGSVRTAGTDPGGERSVSGNKDSSTAGGQQSSTPQTPSHPSRMKPARHSAKELPVWLISMFLLVHCEMEAFLRCTSGEDEQRFGNTSTSPLNIDGSDGDGSSALDFSALLHHKSLSPRTRLHAGTHQNNANCASFLLRHLRKFILLCAVPRNIAACKAVATLAARGAEKGTGGNSRSNIHRYSGVGSSIDIAATEQQHTKEHGNIGLNIELTVEELDRLHLVIQAPSGGLVDDPPIAIGEHILRCLIDEELEMAREQGKPNGVPSSHRWNLMQNGLITVADAERILRRYLEEELTMAKQELDGDDHETSEDVASKLSKLSLAPLSPSRARGISLASESSDAADALKDSSYLKELSYQKLRSTTVLLEPGKDTVDKASPINNAASNAGDANSIADSQNDQQSQTSRCSSVNQPCANATDSANEKERLHDLHIADCSDTHFYLLQPFEHATIAACTDCTIVLGAVAGLLHVVDCERTTITSAARRVVVSNSFDVVHYLFTPSPPLLVGDNRGCQFAPYNTYYEGLREDLLSTGLAAVLRSANAASNNSSSGSVADNTTASPGRGGDRSTSPTSSGLPTLQCASNKWKVPVELCKLEVPQLPNVSTPGSPGGLESSGSLSPGADDRALGGSVDVAMKTPVLLPSSEFDVLLVPVESEEARIRRQLLRESQAEATMAAAACSEDENPATSSDGGDEANDTTTIYSTTSSLTGITGDKDKGEQPPPPLESDYCRILADLLTLSPFHMPHDYERRVIAKAERVRMVQQAMQELNEEQRTSLEEELNRGFQDWLVTSGNLRQILDLIHLEKRVAT